MQKRRREREWFPLNIAPSAFTSFCSAQFFFLFSFLTSSSTSHTCITLIWPKLFFFSRHIHRDWSSRQNTNAKSAVNNIERLRCFILTCYFSPLLLTSSPDTHSHSLSPTLFLWLSLFHCDAKCTPRNSDSCVSVSAHAGVEADLWCNHGDTIRPLRPRGSWWTCLSHFAVASHSWTHRVYSCSVELRTDEASMCHVNLI